MKSFAKDHDRNGDEQEGGLFENSVWTAPISPEMSTAKNRIVPLKSSRMGDGDENTGRTDSQQSVDLVKYRSKKDSPKVNKYLEDFDMMIDDQEEEIRRIVNNNVIDLSSHKKAFSENFQSVYSLVATKTTDHAVDQSPGGYHESSCLKQKCTAIVTNAMNLPRVFQRSICKLESPQAAYSITTTWEEDVQSLNSVLEAGRDVGFSKVKNIVNNGTGRMNDSKIAGIQAMRSGKGEGIAQHICWTMALKK